MTKKHNCVFKSLFIFHVGLLQSVNDNFDWLRSGQGGTEARVFLSGVLRDAFNVHGGGVFLRCCGWLPARQD